MAEGPARSSTPVGMEAERVAHREAPPERDRACAAAACRATQQGGRRRPHKRLLLRHQLRAPRRHHLDVHLGDQISRSREHATIVEQPFLARRPRRCRFGTVMSHYLRDELVLRACRPTRGLLHGSPFQPRAMPGAVSTGTSPGRRKALPGAVGREEHDEIGNDGLGVAHGNAGRTDGEASAF